MSKQKLEINWIPAAGSALGAVTSAVVLSTLGVGGTLIGAALGSLTITVGGSIYAQSMQRTKAHVGERIITARKGVRPNNTSQESTTYQTNPVGTVNASRVGTLPAEPIKPAQEPKRGIFSGLPWKRIIGVTAALFAVVMAIILVFELMTGRAVSSFTGGTSGTGGTSIPGISNAPSDKDDSATEDAEDPGTEDPATDEPKQEQVPGQEQPPQQEQKRQRDTEPAPLNQEPAPAPQNQEPAPAPLNQEPAPAPLNQAPAPREMAPAPEEPAAP